LPQNAQGFIGFREISADIDLLVKFLREFLKLMAIFINGFSLPVIQGEHKVRPYKIDAAPAS